MKHSVESRFVAIISAALLVIVAPLFGLFIVLSSQQATRNLNEHVDVLLATNSQALGKPLWDLDVDGVDQIAFGLVADPAIQRVRIDDTSGKLTLEKNSRTLLGQHELKSVARPITYRSPRGDRAVGTLTLYVPVPGWFAAIHEMELAIVSLFIVAVLAVVGAALVGNRVMVIKPLLRLTAAIEATRRLGSRHHVDWRSNDEIGRLARSYNEMQTLLEREERELKRAHRNTTRTYNLTPAMLFSLTCEDRIAAVSDYWLLATGYSRNEVVGLSFCDLVAREDRARYEARRTQSDKDAPVREVTVRFMRKDGRMIDVLIAETELAARSAGIDDEPLSYRRSNDAQSLSNHGTGGSLSVMTDVTELKQSEVRNHHQAISDYLTGLLNRQGFETVLDEKIAEADKVGTPVACLFVDLDRFKAINDNHGHAAGDSVLRQFSARLTPMLDTGDVASRLGGDEFAVLLTGADAEQRAIAMCDRLVDIVDEPFRAEGTSVRLSASIGLACYPAHATTAADLLQKSDLAMYARKRDGKNGARVYDPAMLDKTRERAEIENDIELALAARWFEAHFQPIVDMASGRTTGFEALMRLRHPRKGLLSPAAIIAVAEENGTIGAIGNLVLEGALDNLQRLSALPGMSNVYVAVNFSPVQFEPSLPLRLASLMDRRGIHPARLVIEITEAVLMHDNPQIRTILNQLHDCGFRIALDDFGTGYSSLSYLSRFPVDIVKIDQSFTRSLAEPGSEVGHRSRMLIEGIAAISHKMNAKVVAEGVETEEQRRLLGEIGIDFAQGYHFARPQAISDLLSALTATDAARASLAS
ncbi:MAG: EAL domain-containing protein [Neorhizobium sp.]|nr:EAL domain-containing protein [Neorhizobium sp.]